MRLGGAKYQTVLASENDDIELTHEQLLVGRRA
jgi:hypothetical protein